MQKARNAALVTGVENVYSLMRSKMLRALRTALVADEKPYYEAIAARKPYAVDENHRLKPEHQLDRELLGRVFRTASQNNFKVMKKHGVTAAGANP